MLNEPENAERWVRQILERLAVSWEVPGYSARVRLAWSTRLTRSIARCRPEQRVVTLAEWLKESGGKLLEEVVCHEFAHLVVFDRHGRTVRPHGREWAALVRSAGFEPRARLVLTDGIGPTARGGSLYEHRCPVCQARRVARRAVRQWRCRACLEAGLSGELEVHRVERRGCAL